MKRATREWVAKAEADWKAANTLARGNQRMYDAVCFHCQQSAEKFLKALLEELGVSIPKTHDLERLLNLLIPHHPELRSHRRVLRPLTKLAIATRYPGDNANKRQALAARRWAKSVREACRKFLCIRPLQQRRRSKLP
jgi:HEPN domain-containing protein